MQTKIINNSTWLIVTEIAEKLFESGKYELFKLYSDGSESLIENETDLIDAKQKEFEIGYCLDAIPYNLREVAIISELETIIYSK